MFCFTKGIEAFLDFWLKLIILNNKDYSGSPKVLHI